MQLHFQVRLKRSLIVKEVLIIINKKVKEIKNKTIKENVKYPALN